LFLVICFFCIERTFLSITAGECLSVTKYFYSAYIVEVPRLNLPLKFPFTVRSDPSFEGVRAPGLSLTVSYWRRVSEERRTNIEGGLAVTDRQSTIITSATVSAAAATAVNDRRLTVDHLVTILQYSVIPA